MTRPAHGLARASSGAASIEFALSLPMLMLLGMYGAEIAYMQSVNLQVSQLATSLADNASRLGQTDNSGVSPTITETDVDAVMFGAMKQGEGIRLSERGRVVLSSLERDGVSGRQYIHWQRCRGLKNATSTYGEEGDVLPDGIGPDGLEVTAEPGDAVIFVQINYTYQPLISAQFMGNLDIHSIASFTVRDDRDLTQIYQRDPADPDTIQRCSAFTGTPAIGANGKMS